MYFELGPAHLKNHAGLLQQVRPHVGSDDVVPSAETDLYVLSKATAVVVPSGFSVSDGLLDRRLSVSSNMSVRRRSAAAEPV